MTFELLFLTEENVDQAGLNLGKGDWVGIRRGRRWARSKRGLKKSGVFDESRNGLHQLERMKKKKESPMKNVVE